MISSNYLYTGRLTVSFKDLLWRFESIRVPYQPRNLQLVAPRGELSILLLLDVQAATPRSASLYPRSDKGTLVTTCRAL